MKKKQKIDRHKKRAFGFSFLTTLCIILLLWGLVRADFQSRRISTGDQTPPVSFVEDDTEKTYLHVYSMGIDEKLNVTPAANLWDKLMEFLCLTNE